MDIKIVEVKNNFRSKSQIGRIRTETWVKNNLYCPICGSAKIEKLENNRPVSDFKCPHCNELFELKSSTKKYGGSVLGGNYNKMIEVINSNNVPNFIFLHYNSELIICNLFIVPKCFFTSQIIKKREPLKSTAIRAGYIGSNILLEKIPNCGKIYLIKNFKELSKSEVLKKLAMIKPFNSVQLNEKGWTFEVLSIVENLPNEFLLEHIYEKEKPFRSIYPKNNNIKEKIRQQLQILRDLGFIMFIGNGKYQKVKY
ncbi:MAG: DpnI domain-containing protein [Clostridia bacterium]